MNTTELDTLITLKYGKDLCTAKCIRSLPEPVIDNLMSHMDKYYVTEHPFNDKIECLIYYSYNNYIMRDSFNSLILNFLRKEYE